MLLRLSHRLNKRINAQRKRTPTSMAQVTAPEPRQSGRGSKRNTPSSGLGDWAGERKAEQSVPKVLHGNLSSVGRSGWWVPGNTSWGTCLFCFTFGALQGAPLKGCAVLACGNHIRGRSVEQQAVQRGNWTLVFPSSCSGFGVGCVGPRSFHRCPRSACSGVAE